MSVTLVVGGSGLLGSWVTRLLVERGDDVRVTVRPTSRLDNLHDLDVTTVTADMLDRAAMRRAMRGVDRVFHVGGMTNFRAHPQALWRANVEGTRVALEEALRAGIERVVYTSSVAAVGPASRRSTADETQPFPRGADAIPYVRAKRELGWKPSHHEDTLETTIAWYREREPQRLRPPGDRQPLALRVAGGVLRQADGLAGRLVP